MVQEVIGVSSTIATPHALTYYMSVPQALIRVRHNLRRFVRLLFRSIDVYSESA